MTERHRWGESIMVQALAQSTPYKIANQELFSLRMRQFLVWHGNNPQKALTFLHEGLEILIACPNLSVSTAEHFGMRVLDTLMVVVRDAQYLKQSMTIFNEIQPQLKRHAKCRDLTEKVAQQINAIEQIFNNQ